MSDTPRTDDVAGEPGTEQMVSAEFARKLERELAAAEETITGIPQLCRDYEAKLATIKAEDKKHFDNTVDFYEAKLAAAETEKERLSISSLEWASMENKLAGAEKDADRWDTFCELWALSTELSATQDEDGRWSVSQTEPVESILFSALTGDTPNDAIDKATK